MLKKGTKLNSILTGTCPRCQNESMYVKQNPYHLSDVLTMQEECSHCKLVYQIEPSFFYGAMYVSYGVNVAVGIAAFIIAHVIIGLELVPSFIAIVVTLLVLYPPILRISRNMYINMFVSYDPEAKS
jgi:uncharacterized protein (DUF983 family)